MHQTFQFLLAFAIAIGFSLNFAKASSILGSSQTTLPSQVAVRSQDDRPAQSDQPGSQTPLPDQPEKDQPADDQATKDDPVADDQQKDDQPIKDEPKDDEQQDDEQEDDEQKEDDPKPDEDENAQQPQMKKLMRVDCRYHNVENISGIDHCYASAIYFADKKRYSNVRVGIGCDQQTIYNDKGRVHIEQVGERISPKTAAFPAIEVFPRGALKRNGTYESILDLRAGRLAGTCYVHTVHKSVNENNSHWDAKFVFPELIK